MFDVKFSKILCVFRVISYIVSNLKKVQDDAYMYYCLFEQHTYIFVLRAHAVHGESHNQRNTTGEVATAATLVHVVLCMTICSTDIPTSNWYGITIKEGCYVCNAGVAGENL